MYFLSDEKESPFPVIGRIINKKKSKEFHNLKSIYYSTLRQEFRMHLSPFVDDISKFGLYSIEAGGASNPGLRNVDRYLLDRHAEWRNPTQNKDASSLGLKIY